MLSFGACDTPARAHHHRAATTSDQAGVALADRLRDTPVCNLRRPPSRSPMAHDWQRGSAVPVANSRSIISHGYGQRYGQAPMGVRTAATRADFASHEAPCMLQAPDPYHSPCAVSKTGNF